MISKNLIPVLLCVVTFAVTLTTSSLVLGPNATRPCVCLQLRLMTKKALAMLEETGGAGRFFLMEQRGVVYSFSSEMTGQKLFVNMTSLVEYDANGADERGLLSIALHPRFSENGKFYTYSIRKFNSVQYAYVTELQEVSGRVDVSREKLIMVIQQHNARRNGGQLLFGNDGYLHIFVGDGGLRSSAQNMSSLLGKILRVNIDDASVADNLIRYYSIPPDNPDVNGLPEIYAWGFRNPWRCSLDIGSTNGDIYCGDLGEGAQEEINRIQKGRNYGWDIKEGAICNDHPCNMTGPEGNPIFTYNHSKGPAAVIGGYVYRGLSIKNLTGRYLFADIFSKNFLYTLKASSEDQWEENHLYYCDPGVCPCHARESVGEDYLVSFSQDRKGEVYLLTTKSFTGLSTGDRLLKLVSPNHDFTVCRASSHFSLWTTISGAVVSLTLQSFLKNYFHIL